MRKYQNPDPRCQYHAKGSVGYCWIYVDFVDGNMKGPDVMLVICRACDMFDATKETADGGYDETHRPRKMPVHSRDGVHLLL